MPKQETFLPKKQNVVASRKIEFRTIPKATLDHTIKIPKGEYQNKKPFSYDNNNINMNNVSNFKPEHAPIQKVPSKSNSFFKTV